MVAAANWFGHLDVTCGRACESKEVRVRWGCDAPAPEPAYGIVCWRCWGEPERAGACSLCGGEGFLPLDRCPSHYIGHAEVAVLRAYRFARRGDWPVQGTWRDQSHSFVEAADALGRAWAYHEHGGD